MIKKKGLKVEAEEAVKVIKSGDRVIIPICCGEPQTILEAMVKEKDRLRNVEIVGGLLVNYKFLEEGMEESFHFRTWQCTGKIAKLLGKNVHYMPIRQGDVPLIFRKSGSYPVDVSIIHVSPPDKHGFCSLGVSISHSLPTALEAKVVIAEVNKYMPRVLGNSFIHVSQIDYLVEVERPLVEYRSSEKIGEKERQISQFVTDLIPDGATLQIGIGAIPEAVVEMLAPKNDLRFFGMAVDAIVDLVEKGVVTTSRRLDDQCKIRPAEILGTKKLFDMVDNNPMVFGLSSEESINARTIGNIDKFVSLQSAIEIDLSGQVNIETIRGRQFSAIGGSHDFLQGSYYSSNGKSIIAMNSTASEGKISRIVPSFAQGTAIAHPRHSVQYVVTEYGVAYLRGKTLEERSKELISIAHPDFRDELRKSARI